MPISITASNMIIVVKVRRARTTAGSRKALTPLLMASTPVIAVQPLEKERMRSQRLAAIVTVGNGGGISTGSGRPPLSTALTVPMASTVNSETTNRYVGTTNAS